MAAFKFAGDDRKFVGLPIGDAQIQMGRDVVQQHSKSIGAGVAIYDPIKIPAAPLHYDCYYYVIDGEFSVVCDGQAITCRRGDAVFIQAETVSSFETKKRTVIVYANYPVDWKERLAKH